jgi:hypothetical protein
VLRLAQALYGEVLMAVKFGQAKQGGRWHIVARKKALCGVRLVVVTDVPPPHGPFWCGRCSLLRVNEQDARRAARRGEGAEDGTGRS